jgi:tripartite-type tricarboxylate transporter receptor subunit TctC
MKRLISACAGAVALCALPAHAQKDAAAAYPDKPVRWIVPFTPGASNDIIARLVGARLGDAWGQQFVIDNRPGAGGAIGAETVARALPDGYTLLLANPGPSVNAPLMARKPTYSPNDFTNIVFIGYAPLILLANPSFAPKNPKELLDYIKANPGKVAWGSSGVGSSLHIGLALFQASTGANVIHVPYKGSAPALTDVVGGQIQLMHTTTVSGGEQIKAGKVKVIGAATAKRMSNLPDVPTLAEAGIKDAEAIVWFGMSGPPKLPRAIVDKLNREVNRILGLPDVKARLDQLGLEVEGGTPEAFDKFVKGEVVKIERLIKAGYLKPE